MMFGDLVKKVVATRAMSFSQLAHRSSPKAYASSRQVQNYKIETQTTLLSFQIAWRMKMPLPGKTALWPVPRHFFEVLFVGGDLPTLRDTGPMSRNGRNWSFWAVGWCPTNTALQFASLAGLGTAVASASLPRERWAERVRSNRYHYSLSFWCWRAGLNNC